MNNARQRVRLEALAGYTTTVVVNDWIIRQRRISFFLFQISLSRIGSAGGVLRSCMRALFRTHTESANTLAAKTCFMHVNGRKAFNRLDNYRFRGPLLDELCFFEYCMLVRNCRMKDSISTDVQYGPRHPKYWRNHVPRCESFVTMVSFLSFRMKRSRCDTVTPLPQSAMISWKFSLLSSSPGIRL